jgi:putative DNA methylase
MTHITTGGFKLLGPWRSRGYLPHFDGDQTPQFVTYRLAGTLPKKMLVLYREKLERGIINEIEYHELVDEYLDRNYGESFLRLSEIAALVEENLLRFDDVKYNLHAWVVMPNHVHVLFTPTHGYKLPSIMHSTKSYTATQANKLLRRSGDFWAREYFDRYIRNADHFVNTVNYIHSDPVKAGLCASAEDWTFSSARFLKGE